jgi:NTE family protein
LNGVAFAADPTPEGISSLGAGWRRTKRAEVFPLWSPSLVLAAIGRRDHFLDNRGLARLIGQIVRLDRLEGAVIPAHVVATDLFTGDPVVLSNGPAGPALLASTAIPAVFPPVEIGGRLLIDGGVAADTPTIEAEAMGAATILVLPTYGAGPAARPGRSATSVGLYAIGQLLGHSGATAIAATPHAVVHVLPAPPTAGISPFDLSHSGQLINQAAELTRAWLADVDPFGLARPAPTNRAAV